MGNRATGGNGIGNGIGNFEGWELPLGQAREATGGNGIGNWEIGQREATGGNGR